MSINTSKFSFSWNTVAARGFADGDAITAEFDNDSSTSYSGTKGEGSVVTGVDRRATITVRLQADSKTVPEYIGIDKAMRLGELNDVVPFIYKKIVGYNTITMTGTCTLSKIPVPTSNREMPELEFIFKSSDAELVVLNGQ
jgi:hypothetical protein